VHEILQYNTCIVRSKSTLPHAKPAMHRTALHHGHLHGEQAGVPVVARAEVRQDQLLRVDLCGKAGGHLRGAVAVYPSVILDLAVTINVCIMIRNISMPET
jgi:hypothetical protein